MDSIVERHSCSILRLPGNEALTFAEAMAHPGALEGIAAFLEKRKAKFEE